MSESMQKAVWGSNEFHPNCAVDIVAQTCLAVPYIEGGTGEGKTQLSEDLGRVINYNYTEINLSLCDAIEIGGVPFPDFNAGHTVVLPMDWTDCVTKPKQLLHFDEVPCTPAENRPIILRALSERRLGAKPFAPDLIIIASGNPPEMTPNGTVFERSMMNRFYHHKWKLPKQTWLSGMMNDCNFPSPVVPVLPADWKAYRGKWASLIGSYVNSSGNFVSPYNSDEEATAFGTLRSWHRLAVCLAACESVGAQPEVYAEICEGTVGEAFAHEFLENVASHELYDPEAVLDRKVTVDFNSRIDILHCLPSAILRVLGTKQGMSLDRFDAATEFFQGMAEVHADLVLEPLGAFWELQPKGYQFSTDWISRMGALFAQVNPTT